MTSRFVSKEIREKLEMRSCNVSVWLHSRFFFDTRNACQVAVALKVPVLTGVAEEVGQTGLELRGDGLRCTED